jgi:hypothetical protein
MNMQARGFSAIRTAQGRSGLSDPLRTVDAVNMLQETARQGGYAFNTSNDFSKLAEWRGKLRGSQVSPMFDLAVNRHLDERAFWMWASDQDGTPVAVQSFRLDDADPDLGEWALGWMMGLYAKRQELVVPSAAHVPDHSITSLITGPVAYHGELWIDNHHKGLFETFTRMGMLLSLVKWQPEALWCLGSKAMATRGHFTRSGYVHIERSFLRWTWEPAGADQVEWIGIADSRHLEFLVSEMTTESRYPLSSLP